MFLIRKQSVSEIKGVRSDYPVSIRVRSATLNQRTPSRDIGVGNAIPITYYTLALSRDISAAYLYEDKRVFIVEPRLCARVVHSRSFCAAKE